MDSYRALSRLKIHALAFKADFSSDCPFEYRMLVGIWIAASAYFTFALLQCLAGICSTCHNNGTSGTSVWKSHCISWLHTIIWWQEYRRTAHLLKDCQSSKAWFLRCYSLYLAGEKRKEEERIELSGPLGRAETINKASPAAFLHKPCHLWHLNCHKWQWNESLNEWDQWWLAS